MMNRHSTAVEPTSAPALPAPDFHALSLAGSIDLLTGPLRGRGTAIKWQTPHHGVEIDAWAAVLLYRAAADILAAVPAEASGVTIRLAAVYHGIRLTIEDNAAGSARRPELEEHLRMAAEPAGGRLVLEPLEDAGTRVVLTLPLD